MGFPLSRFQHLSTLCKKESSALEEFSRFRLTAIVLHKSRSSAFRRVMQENFEHLSTSTGDDFAFITFLDPPEKWAEEHRSWMLTRETLMADNGNYSSEDFLEALCSRLSIQKLPAIVLTDNLNSSRYAVLQSSSILCMLESLKQEVCFAPFNTERFISSVNNFKEYRNDTPHPIVIDREDFRRMDRMFDSLFQGMDDSSVQPQTKPSGTRNNRFIVCKILS